ncbi:MAG: NACHT domain-containing protein [Chitinophagaceae bacterium]|nr:NACHT domain-containing protein [Chitinophagaceae bacterium]
MKDHWRHVKKSIGNNIKGVFEKNADPSYENFDNGIELFKNIIFHKTGNKNLDGLAEPILEAIFEIYGSKPGGINQCKSILNSLEPFLKKIIFIISGRDLTRDKTKNLIFCLKELGLLVDNPTLDAGHLRYYIGMPNFLEHVCRSVVERNTVHNAPQPTVREIYDTVESALVVYMYATLEHFEDIKVRVGNIVTADMHLENYKNYALSILSYNLSLKMLEADFGVKVQALDEFQIKLKARAKKRKEERDEYLKDSSNYNIIPIKFLPEIEGVISNQKYILLHGIATSGKTTILKKLGRDFLDRYNSPYLFYIQLGEIFKVNNGSSIIQEIRSVFRGKTSLDFQVENVKDRILIILDGLDEVPIKESRDKIIKELVELKKYNNIQIVLSSRTNDYITNNSVIDDYFEKFELMPVTASDIVSIGEKILGHGTQFNSFVKMVRKGSLLKAFPKTPLTSILLAILFKEKNIDIKELPKNITELYKKFIDLFLNRWDQSKGISEQFEIQKKEFVLQTIADHMHKNKMISISASDLEDFITDLSTRKNLGGPQDSAEHLRNLCDRTSILIKDEFNGEYKFFHLTIQEYLAAQKFDHKDDDILVRNFYDEWWLNPNIFYAGNKTDYPDVLKRIAKLEFFPADGEKKFNHFAHASQVLLAAHNIDNDVRRDVLLSMIKMFDEFSKEFINILVNSEDDPELQNRQLAKLRDQTLLDIILNLRDMFMEFFAMEDFKSDLERIWTKLLMDNSKLNMCDITLYSLSYCLAIQTKDAKYLEEFVLTDNIEINSRWFKIVDVDISIKKLINTQKKIKFKIRNIATKNNEYIQKQFKERIKRHYLSLTGMDKG